MKQQLSIQNFHISAVDTFLMGTTDLKCCNNISLEITLYGKVENLCLNSCLSCVSQGVHTLGLGGPRVKTLLFYDLGPVPVSQPNHLTRLL